MEPKDYIVSRIEGEYAYLSVRILKVRKNYS